jgi:hypothetical protein
MAKRLGWFSLALGAGELFAASRLTRALGMQGHEALIRGFGLREIGSGMATLGTQGRVGVWSRVAGDALDLAVLASAMRQANRKRGNVAIALAAVAGVTLLDIATGVALDKRHRRTGTPRSYADRSGWPQGSPQTRGAGHQSGETPSVPAAPASAAASPVTGETSPMAAVPGVVG